MPILNAEFSNPIDQAIRGKVCLITGASRTLGATIARRMAHYGAQVAINYHQSQHAAETLCAELTELGAKAVAIGADVTDPDQVAQLIATTEADLGAIDLLVNNVGPYVDTPFLALSLTDFDRILAGNVRATFLLTQGVGRLMKARGKGQIINIAATDICHRSHSIYGLAKQAVVHLTEAMALELAPPCASMPWPPICWPTMRRCRQTLLPKPSAVRLWAGW